jgi:hypothetical protein
LKVRTNLHIAACLDTVIELQDLLQAVILLHPVKAKNNASIATLVTVSPNTEWPDLFV